MDAPLSSILRPGPAAPNNEPQRQATPVEGDGDAMRAIEGQPVARPAVDQRPLPGLRTESAAAMARPVTQPVGDTLASARAAFETQQARVEPVRPTLTPERRAPDADDIFAGLEAAALRDIGEELSRATATPASDERTARSVEATSTANRVTAESATVEAGGATLSPAEREERRAARLRNKAADADGSGAGTPDAAQREARRAARLEKQAAAGATAADETEKGQREARRAARLARQASETAVAAETASDNAKGPRAARRAARLEKQAAAGAVVASETDKRPRAERRAARLEKQAAGTAVVAGADATSRKDRRAARMKNAEGRSNTAGLPAPAAVGALAGNKDAPVKKRDKGGPTIAAPREWGIPWTAISFVAMVLIPAMLTAFYYIMLASPQYQVETQFSVRGSSASSMSTLGLGSILGGTTAQSGDSYIVTSYVESLQLIRDVQQELGIDLRQFYARDHIDWLYRIEPDLPLEKFTDYWRSMTDVSFNATTGNTTLFVYGFTAEDSKAIADAVVKVSERLVNQLSESNRQQMMQVASKQVDRAEERLRKVQAEIRRLRVNEKVTDPITLIQMQTQAVSSLRSQLTTLETRYNALMKSVSRDAPQAKSLLKQIEALRSQITEQEAQLGTSTPNGKKDLSAEEKANLAEVLNKFEELTIEQNFATQAYTTALAAFETAIVEAQRQERYFATFVTPTRPEIALYPLRYLDSFIAFLVLLAVWMAAQFLYRSFRDHAV